MNQVLAQNATQLAVSNGAQEWDYAMFLEAAGRAGSRVMKKDSITRERRMINRSKLISAVCADYRSHFVALYGKTDRLPTQVFANVEKAVDEYINQTLSTVNPANALSYSRGFHVNVNQLEVTERVRLIGENKIDLKEQLFAVNMFINQAQKRIDNVPAAIDREKLQAMKLHLIKLNSVKMFIENEIATQKEVAS